MAIFGSIRALDMVQQDATRFPRSSADRRRTPRFKGKAEATIVSLRGPLPCFIVDASLTGLQVVCREGGVLPKQARIRVSRHHLELVITRVWHRGSNSGWKINYEGARLPAVLGAIADLNRKLGGMPATGTSR